MAELYPPVKSHARLTRPLTRAIAAVGADGSGSLGLHPLQIKMHSAALFAILTETARLRRDDD